jgi:hypothetical protein
VDSRAAVRNSTGRGDLEWLPPLFLFSPAVTCRKKKSQQPVDFSFFLSLFFRSASVFTDLFFCFPFFVSGGGLYD